jgi:hypothetical protein
MSTSTAVIILALIMAMVIIASIFQAADKRRRERARIMSYLRRRTTMLQELLSEGSIEVLTPRLRLLVLHSLLNVYKQMLKVTPRDQTIAERYEQTRVMIGAVKEQIASPFELKIPETKAGLSEARSALRTVGKMLNNLIEAKTLPTKETTALKFDLQNNMLEIQIHSHDQLAKEAEHEKKYNIAAHNISTCITLLQRSNHPHKMERLDEFKDRLMAAQENLEMYKEAKKRERERREKDWKNVDNEDGIFLKKHAYDD